ncbi:MAG: alpha/beta hydrolase [Steroidobacteraceae bacterium]
MSRPSKRAYRSLLTALLTLFAARDALAESAARIELTPCRLEANVGAGATSARCGWFDVPEDRSRPQGRHIRLHVAVVPALSLNPAPDPFVFITGGPGQAPSEEYPTFGAAFERIRRVRDILLLDQRGTGLSHRLHCAYSEETEVASADRERWRSETQRCLRELPADVRFYTTSTAVADLEAVRSALGYQQLNLWGGSYGTRVAQHYVRRYPNRVRSVILDGVVPPELILGPGVPLDAQHALDAILTRCVGEPHCARAFPQVQQELKGLREQLRAPREVEFQDPITGMNQTMSFGLPQLAGVVRLLSYSDETAALLPYLIHYSYESEDLRPWAGQFTLFVNPLAQRLANGMQNSVVCTEDVPFMQIDASADRAIAESYLGSEFIASMRDICGIWPRGVMDADLHSPLRSAVPALLVSGENDPVTPPSYGERAAKAFTRGRHVMVRGQGHINSATGCMPVLLERFVETTNAAGLDARCLEQVQAAPFLLSPTASAP